MNSFSKYLSVNVYCYRWVIISISILIAIISSYGLEKLSFSNDPRIFFSPENPQLMALDALERDFSRENNIMFVLEPVSGNVFDSRSIAAVEWLTEKAWKIPFSRRVSSLTNFQYSYSEKDDLVVENLVEDSQSLVLEDLLRIRDIALSEPLLVNRLLSPDGRVTGVDVVVVRPEVSVSEISEIAEYGRALSEEFRKKFPSVNIYLTGGVMMDNAFGEASREDIRILVPIMYVALLTIMALSLQSLICTCVAFLVIFFSMLVALGAAGWWGIILSAPTANAPTIILTLAVADSIHLLTTVVQLMKQGQKKKEAVMESVRVNFKPVLVTSVTTAIGFFSMNFSDVPPFRDLGNVVGCGVIFAFIFSILLLPALIYVLPLNVPVVKSGDYYSQLFEKLSWFIVDKKNGIIISVLLFGLAVAPGISFIELNDNFIKYFDESYDFRIATDFAENKLTGLTGVEYRLSAKEKGGINDPEYLKMVESFASWYRKQDKVDHVLVITDIVKRLNRNMNGDDWLFYTIPDNRELVAQYLLLYEMSLPFGHDLNNIIDMDKSSSRMFVRFSNITSKELREIDDAAQNWLAKNTPESMNTYGSGLAMVFAYVSERNINSMLFASFGALFLISGLLVIIFRSVKFGLISLFPNILPALMAFGLWGILVGQVGLVVSILAALTLGIVVDDTVHFLSKYLIAKRDLGKSAEESVAYAMRSVGKAMWTTTVVLVVGFMVLSFSGFQLNSHMGLMTAITIVIALVLDLLFLPALLIKIDN